MPTPLKLKTPFRVAPPYLLVQRLRSCPPSVACRETLRSTMKSMLPRRNHRLAASAMPSPAAATAQDHRPAPSRGRQHAHWLVPVAWRINAALRARVLTTARTSERRCRRRQRRLFGAFLQLPKRLRLRRQQPQQRPPIPHQQRILPRRRPPQSLPRHPNNQQRRRQRLTTMAMKWG